MYLPNLKSVVLPPPEIIQGYPKNLGSPWIRPRSFFSKICNRLLFGLALYMYPSNLKSVALLVPEIRGGSCCKPPISIRGHRGSGMVPFERAFVSSYKPSIHIINLSALVWPKFQIAVLGGGCEPPILGKGRPQGVWDGTIRNSVGEFLQAVHSNFSSIFTRFRDIAAFVLQHATFSLPHLESPQNFPMFPWEQLDRLLATKSEVPGLIVCAITQFPRFPTYVITNHQSYRQTDRRTDDMRSQSALRGKNVTYSLVHVMFALRSLNVS